MSVEGYTEDCNAECFEFGGDNGCPGWTHEGQDRRQGSRSFPLDFNDIHPDFEPRQECLPSPAPTGEPAYVRLRQRPTLSMGIAGGGELPLDTLHKIAERWHGMVVIPRETVQPGQVY